MLLVPSTFLSASIPSSRLLIFVSVCLSPLHKEDAWGVGESEYHWRYEGDRGGVVCLHTHLLSYVQFLFLLWCPSPFSFSLMFLFFSASFLFHLVPSTKRRILSKKVDFEVLQPSSFPSLPSIEFRSWEYEYSTSNSVRRFYKGC